MMGVSVTFTISVVNMASMLDAIHLVVSAIVVVRFSVLMWRAVIVRVMLMRVLSVAGRVVWSVLYVVDICLTERSSQ